MFLPNDLKSRLKGLRHPRAKEMGEATDSQLVAWTSLLLLGIIAIVVVATLSIQRFSYWKDIDVRLMGQSGAVTYDEAALEKVLAEFEARSGRTEEILMDLSMIEDEVATTTDTTTATSSESEVE